MVTHKQLLRDLTVMIRMKDCTQRGEVDIEKAVRVNAANITNRTQRLPGQVLLPMLEGEVHHSDLSIDVVEGIEAVVGLLVALDGDGVAVVDDGRHGDHKLARLRGVEHHDADTAGRSGEVERRRAAVKAQTKR